MTKIIIGTTPTITYKFSVVSVSDITSAILTIRDRGSDIIRKTLEDAVVNVTDNTLSWTLTQQDTLDIGVKSASIMLNWKLNDGTRGASKEEEITGANNHIREVMT